jgi:hypothetical protein
MHQLIENTEHFVIILFVSHNIFNYRLFFLTIAPKAHIVISESTLLEYIIWLSNFASIIIIISFVQSEPLQNKGGPSMECVAVILNERNEIAAVGEPGSSIRIYRKDAQGWRTRSSFPTGLDLTSPLPVLRGELTALAAKLGDARILVGRTVGGLVYQIFNRLNFQIVEADHFSPELLDRISVELKTEKEVSHSAADFGPQETEVPGEYFLDLAELQQKLPEISSKIALQPFFKETPFMKITVLCRHLPPWIEPYAQGKGWKVKTEPMQNGTVKAVIIPGICQ